MKIPTQKEEHSCKCTELSLKRKEDIQVRSSQRMKMIEISTSPAYSFFVFFSVRLLSVLHGHSGFSSRHNVQWPPTSKDFLSQILSITFILRASIFPFKCSVPNKGTTGTILKTSLVWRGPWLGIEPGTSCTQCQHSTTRLSRRWYF